MKPYGPGSGYMLQRNRRSVTVVNEDGVFLFRKPTYALAVYEIQLRQAHDRIRELSDLLNRHNISH